MTKLKKKLLFRLRQIDPRHDVLLTIKLFDMIVTPIIAYGSEIWSPLCIGKIFDLRSICDRLPYEKINVKLCKDIPGVAKLATNAAVLGELGRYPFTLKLLIHSIKFWNRINAQNFSGFVKYSYTDSLDPQLNPTHNTWTQQIKSLLHNLNHSQVWYNTKEEIMPNNMKHLLEHS